MSTAEPILILESMTRRFGGVLALDNVSLHVPEGAIVGVIGPNGAGKTTLFNVITGAYEPTAGRVRFLGEDIVGLRPYQIVRRGLSRTFQNIRLFGSMTVHEHLVVGQFEERSLRSVLSPVRFSGASQLDRAERALEAFGLTSHRNRLATTLPYGVQRKVEMARALTADPRLLLLDEPVAGMNHDEAQDLTRLLRTLRDGGLSLLLIEHDMSFVRSLCDYLYVLDFGSLIAQGPPETICRDPIVIDAYLGEDC